MIPDYKKKEDAYLHACHYNPNSIHYENNDWEVIADRL